MLALAALQIVIVLLHRPGHQWLWIAVNLAVLAAGGLTLAFAPAWSLLAVSLVFFPFVLAPAVLGHLAQRRANMNRPEAAAAYAMWAARLHPSSSGRFLAQLYRALALPDQSATIAALERLKVAAAPRHRAVIATLVAIRRNDWAHALEASQEAVATDKSLRSTQIRALGETGNLDEMIRTFASHKSDLVGSDMLFTQLFVMALTGRVRAVRELLENQLSALHDETKTYWRAIAEHYATDGTIRSPAALERLAGDAERPSTRMACERHLSSSPVTTALGISAKAWEQVEALEQRVVADAPRSRLLLRNMLATLSLMTLLSVMFAVENWYGSSEDTQTLVELGALWPPYVIQYGEWWRLVTAILLHAGWLHFAANMFVLFVLGRIVEATLGPLRTVAGFFVGGTASSAAVLAAMEWGYTEQAILIGASGGIFALFGIEVAMQLARWRRSRDILDRRRVILLAVVMLMQIVIDISMPEISMTAHLSGFAAGLLIGTLFVVTAPRSHH